MSRWSMAHVSEEWIESQYKAWKLDSSSVGAEWHAFFEGFELGSTDRSDQAALVIGRHSGVLALVERYRRVGHLLACTDPLSPCRLNHPLLEIGQFGLTDDDLDTTVDLPDAAAHTLTLRELIALLQATYCRQIGVEFMQIDDPDERQWLIDRMEPCRNSSAVPIEEQLLVLEKLHEAALFEEFLQRRFPGQKRFSLEGGDLLIVVLDALVRSAPAAGVSDCILGMAHRGRLNVLAHIFGKPYQNILAEFSDGLDFGFSGDGDVKYHKGYSCDRDVNGEKVHLTIAANPSHLEAVNAVVEGKCRARQHRYGNDGARRVLPLLVHGDAAFAGQGSIMEVLNMSQLDGYSTGGTIHIVINNQIGFTTLPRDARSTRYATDPAKLLACPVFHVQGESPEAALHTIRLALEYRQTFRRDVVVELICYRRHGHNEGDEPSFTQPLMYHNLVDRPSPNLIYARTLEESGHDGQQLALVERSVADRLEHARGKEPEPRPVGYHDQWSAVHPGYREENSDTGVTGELLLNLSRQLAALPPGFVPHAKIQTLLQKRFESVLKGKDIDWGNAESLAYASLLHDGIPVRISGQDSRRGTFNHRHCQIHDINDGSTFMPLQTVGRHGATFQAWNSLLSEFGVLGFEYGYSLEVPEGLTIWEAQFGDFANGAQVIIDQFISSGETKWNRASGLVMLLPHGYEGQGAEHSSARIERFLQLCAGDNMVLAQPSTPAQFFHLIRRQVLQSFRKPLVVFTPKSLLRHPSCISPLQECIEGTFRTVLPDTSESAPPRRILLCSGKIAYELRSARAERSRHDVAIVTVEQLYPLDRVGIAATLAGLGGAADICWVQEEPENMGAWYMIQRSLAPIIPSLRGVTRPADACPAVGSHHLHAQQQAALIDEAFVP